MVIFLATKRKVTKRDLPDLRPNPSHEHSPLGNKQTHLVENSIWCPISIALMNSKNRTRCCTVDTILIGSPTSNLVLCFVAHAFRFNPGRRSRPRGASPKRKSLSRSTKRPQRRKRRRIYNVFPRSFVFESFRSKNNWVGSQKDSNSGSGRSCHLQHLQVKKKKKPNVKW